ncbi:MAG TPA: hypothetical protein QGF35_06075 [Dehalococcoidia bacterium]|nr:hypothetical protein [Dehalococcoidia bacterium]
MANTAQSEIVANSGAKGLLEVRDSGWSEVEEAELALEPTPLEKIPSAYVQRSWASRNHGFVKSVNMAAAVVGDDLLVRLRWRAPDPKMNITDINVYPDACALLFPLDSKDADLGTMGSRQQPACGWHWRAGADSAFVITAQGLGSVARVADQGLEASAAWAGDEWHVLFRRPISDSHPAITAGASVPVGVAVWTGTLEERAGLKSHSPQWHKLTASN